jgi:16S rRNA (uracil1498-N3)-methyltransferase
METPFDESWFHAPIDRVGDEVELPGPEAHHLRHVLRVREGRSITVTNGRGGVFLCTTSDRKHAVMAAAVEARAEVPAPPTIHVVMGLLKGRDSEDPVEGLCQLPLAAIHLVTTDHSQEFKGQDHSRLLERLNQKSQVGLKQGKKPWLTAIHAPLPLRAWRKSHPGDLVVVHPGPDALPPAGADPLYLLTGPEGGFSEAEIRWLLADENAGRLGLGGTRIRATHAPLLACGKLMGLGLLP